MRFSGPGPYITPDIDDVGFMSISVKLMGVPGPKLMDEERFTVDLFGARFDEPIGPTKEIDVNLGRVVPVKVQLWRNGVEVEQPSAGALLQITECDSPSTVRTYDLAWQPSARRWTARLDTSGLSDGCYQGSILVDGQAAGSFKLVVTGSSPTPASIRARSAGALSASPSKADKKPH